MIMTPSLRKFVLTAHVTSSVGWIGAVVAFLTLVVAALTTKDTQTSSAIWIALELIGWFAIVPLALASLLTGLVLSLGTKWGLFQHYWILFKLLLTIIAIIILLLNMQTVSFFAGIVTETGNADLNGMWGELIHAGGGLLVLLVTMILSVYKPRGMTQFGERKQAQQRMVSKP